nr:transcription factor MYB44-like [Ipomoea batatas]
MKLTNAINNTSTFNAAVTESTVDSKSTCSRNPMPPDFQTPGAVTGSLSSSERKDRQCNSPLPILSTPITDIGLCITGISRYCI